MKTANADMVEGYMDGSNDTRHELPESLANRSHSYRHGWKMGRDDRAKLPYDPYRASRNRIAADEAEKLDRENIC